MEPTTKFQPVGVELSVVEEVSSTVHDVAAEDASDV
jgi:hypothetical protein